MVGGFTHIIEGMSEAQAHAFQTVSDFGSGGRIRMDGKDGSITIIPLQSILLMKFTEKKPELKVVDG